MHIFGPGINDMDENGCQSLKVLMEAWMNSRIVLKNMQTIGIFKR